MRSTANIATGNTPGQIVYRHDIIMQVAIEMNWNNILRKNNCRLRRIIKLRTRNTVTMYLK